MMMGSGAASRTLSSATAGEMFPTDTESLDDDSGEYAVIRMNNRPVNTFNKERFLALEDTIKALEADEKIRGCVITSAIPNIFSAGLDLKAVFDPKEEELREFWAAFESFWKTLYLTPLATVAAVNGACPALGKRFRQQHFFRPFLMIFLLAHLTARVYNTRFALY